MVTIPLPAHHGAPEKRFGEGALRVRLPPRGHHAGGRTHLANGRTSCPEKADTGHLPGSLPPSWVESLASPATGASPNSLGTDVSPLPALIVNTPAMSAAPAADTP